MKRKRNKNKKKKILTAVICAAVLFCAAGIAAVLLSNSFGKKDVICQGVHIGNMDVGGFTESEADRQISLSVAAQMGKEITVDVQGHPITVKAEDLGLAYPEHDKLAALALNIGKKGKFWERFREVRQAKAGKKNVPMEPQIDREQIEAFVGEQCTVYDIKPKNSKLVVKNGKLRATKSRTGLQVKVSETVELLVAELEKGTSEPAQITAEIEETEPEYTKEEVAQCTDLLGSYSTTYSTYQAARSSNVALAAGRINGTILNPGRTFSVVRTIKDRTEANGYQSAPEYSSGKVVDGVGGGVCQVSTTLYNAVINAELEIVERSPHSMMVSYVPVSRDAAISGDYKDFKFRNNLEYPIYIMGSASGGVLNFKIYGHETRPENREISFESEIISKIEPGPEVVTEDPSLPAGYRTVTQSAHVGYRAKLWKIIKVDGTETERIELNSSAYNPSPQYVTVGKQSATPSPEASGGKKDGKGNDQQKKPKQTPKHKQTPKPKPTPKPQATPSPEEVGTDTEETVQ